MSLDLNRSWIVVFVVALVVVLLLPMLWMSSWGGMMGAGMMGRGMMSYGSWGFGFGRMLLGVLLSVGFAILILVGLYHLLSGEAKPSTAQVHTALEILKERYARGEITENQFRKMKEELEH